MTVFHQTMAALDPETAEESLRHLSPNVVLDGRADLRHRLEVHGDDRFSVAVFDVAGSMTGVNAPDDTITIPFATSGQFGWSAGDETGAGTTPFMQSTTAETTAAFGPMHQLNLFLPKGPLTTIGQALYGDAFALAFDGSTAVSPTSAATVASALRLAASTAAMPDVFDTPMIRHSLYRHLAVVVLESFRLRGDRSARSLSAEGRQRAYRVACRFIDDFASLPIGPEDAARAAGLPLADLEEVFRGHAPAGTTVVGHIRAVRLAAAHADLLRTDPSHGETVRSVALRWGFPNPAAFARQYRLTYGVPPKQTLNS